MTLPCTTAFSTTRYLTSGGSKGGLAASVRPNSYQHGQYVWECIDNSIPPCQALTRNDRGQGQYFTRVNRTLVDQLMALNVSGYLTYDSMGRARHLRQQQCAAWNPDYTLPGEVGPRPSVVSCEPMSWNL